MQSRELPSMLGRLQFLESQLFGRVGKLALADLRQIEHSGRSNADLDQSHLDALTTVEVTSGCWPTTADCGFRSAATCHPLY